MRIALVGDSILDNGAYVGGGADVAAHLRDLLPVGAAVDLVARDGSRVEQIESQVGLVSEEATHIIVSAGGNNAIDSLGLFDTPVTNVADALRTASGFYEMFRYRYRGLLKRLRCTGRQISVCTIYEPRFAEGELQTAVLAGLAFFNDVIIREASLELMPVLDLRRVCDDALDFANPIEPSDVGGRKIAQAIARFVTGSVAANNGIMLYW